MGNRGILKTLRRIETGGGWFEVYELSGNVHAIMEPHHLQEVISYLIAGEDKALLFDTGAGIRNIRDVAQKLTDKEILVVNSHAHFDHVGNNHLFDEVIVYSDNRAMDRLRRGYAAIELEPHAKPGLFEPGYAEEFHSPGYSIPPCNPIGVGDGHIIELGGRDIRIMHTPGHSPDSIMLLDEGNKMLFTGDSYYPGHLYAHFEGEFYGNSDIEVYADSMERVSRLADGLSSIHPSHNDPKCDPAILKKAATALRKLVKREAGPGRHLYGDLSIASLPDSGEDYPGYVIPDDLHVYDFDEFKVIARKRH